MESADGELDSRSDLEHEIHSTKPGEELRRPRDVTLKIPRSGRHLPKIGGEDQHSAALASLVQPPRHAPDRLGDRGSHVCRQRSGLSDKPGLEGMAPRALALTHGRSKPFRVGLGDKTPDVDTISDKPHLEGP